MRSGAAAIGRGSPARSAGRPQRQQRRRRRGGARQHQVKDRGIHRQRRLHPGTEHDRYAVAVAAQAAQQLLHLRPGGVAQRFDMQRDGARRAREQQLQRARGAAAEGSVGQPAQRERERQRRLPRHVQRGAAVGQRGGDRAPQRVDPALGAGGRRGRCEPPARGVGHRQRDDPVGDRPRDVLGREPGHRARKRPPAPRPARQDAARKQAPQNLRGLARREAAAVQRIAHRPPLVAHAGGDGRIGQQVAIQCLVVLDHRVVVHRLGHDVGAGAGVVAIAVGG
ncbi:MAG: hypothetical protein ACK56I_18990, partial [bacterium]